MVSILAVEKTRTWGWRSLTWHEVVPLHENLVCEELGCVHWRVRSVVLESGELLRDYIVQCQSFFLLS